MSNTPANIVFAIIIALFLAAGGAGAEEETPSAAETGASLPIPEKPAPGVEAPPQSTIGDIPVSRTEDTPPPPRPDAGWDGELEAGAVITTGNSRTRNLHARFKAGTERETWRHSFTADLVAVSERSVTAAERRTAGAKADYKLSGADYLFFTARYASERFTGYDSRFSESAGYGRRFAPGGKGRLEVEVGAGGTQTRFTDGKRGREGILRLAVKFVIVAGTTSEFTEEAFTEIGEENVHSESQTSIKTRINAAFALKGNVVVKHDTDAPPAKYRTDTVTSLTLVYDF